MKYNFLKSTHQVVLKRLGSSTDGGYLVPLECIKNTKILLSFGLNDDWSFEENFKKELSKLKLDKSNLNGKNFQQNTEVQAFSNNSSSKAL